MQRIKCAEVWGGSNETDADICTNNLTASLFSTTSDHDQITNDAHHSGGDIYYFSVCRHDLITRVCLADVVGHGATVNHISQWLYEALVKRVDDLNGNGLLADLNKLIFARGLEAMTTAAVITFFQNNSSLYFSYAGHPPLILRRKASREWQMLGVKMDTKLSNLPLGILNETTYYQEQTKLASGDRLLLYTDGVTETMNAAGELFGAARLLETLENAGDCSLFEIKQAVRTATLAHAADYAVQDDLTLIAIEIN